MQQLRVASQCVVVRQCALLLHNWNQIGNVHRMPTYSFMPMESPNWDDLGEDEWTRVEGGGLPAAIYIRVELSRDGKPMITGMILGGAWPRNEISANTLRDIKPREILTELFSHFDPSAPPNSEEWEESITWGLMHEVYMMRLPRVPVDSVSTRGASTSDRLAEFAEVYLREMRLQPRRAMTATAKAMNISRATANRWAAMARARGLLASKSEHRPPGGAEPS